MFCKLFHIVLMRVAMANDTNNQRHEPFLELICTGPDLTALHRVGLECLLLHRGARFSH